MELLKELRRVSEDIAEIGVEPKYLLSIAHKADAVKSVWWYNIGTGEMRSSPKSPHSSVEFKDVAYRPGWIRGRVFEFKGKSFLLVYPQRKTKLPERCLLDIVDKVTNQLDIDITYIIDSDGQDLSHVLESIEA